MTAINITTENDSNYSILLNFIEKFYKVTIEASTDNNLKSIFEMSAKEEHDAMLKGAELHYKKKTKSTSLNKHF